MKEVRKIKCGKCGKDVRVTARNRVYEHTGFPGVRCTLGGAYAQYAVNGKRYADK